MKYYIISGEASGDLLGSYLIKALKDADSQADIRCWGGDKMEAAGGALIKHYRELAFMGFVEVVRHLPEIFRNIKFCKQDILQYKPDVLVLIDYPGFNLRIAEWAKGQGIKVAYYVSPQVWAWKENRVKKIKRSVDKMLVILPFEQAFYKKWDFEVEYTGHPLIEVIGDELQKPVQPLKGGQPIIALLPGSRKQEIMVKLPVMLSVVSHFPNHHFIIAQAPSQPDSLYRELIGDHKNVDIVKGATYDVLRQAEAALVTSGTATLETALLGIPEVVCYKGNPISYQLAKKLIKVKFISLVNLIMDKEVVKELIQDELNEQQLVKELGAIIEGGNKRAQLLQQYKALWDLLGAKKASVAAATAIVKMGTR